MKLRSIICAAFAASLALAGAAWADTKISQMPAASALSGSESIPAVQSGANVKLTPAQIATWLNAQPSLFPGYISGNWYAPAFATIGAGASIPTSRIECIMQLSAAPMNAVQLGARNSVAGSASFQLALYTNVNGRPGTLLGFTNSIADNGTPGALSSSAVYNNSGQIAAIPVPAGPYWACVNTGDTSGSTPTFATIAAASGQAAWLAGSSTLANVADSISSMRLSLWVTQTYGTWPTTMPTMSEQDSVQNAMVLLQAQ